MRDNSCINCFASKVPEDNCGTCILSSNYQKSRSPFRRLYDRPGIIDTRVYHKENIISRNFTKDAVEG